MDPIVFPLLVLKPDGSVDFANAAAQDALAPGGAPLSGRRIEEFFSPPSGKDFIAALRRCGKNGAAADLEVKTTSHPAAASPEGREFHFTLARYDRPGGAGEPLIIAAGRDVTEQKRKDLEFIRFRNLAHNTVNPLEITDTEGRIIYVNPAFEKASGYSGAELTGRNPNIFSSGKHPPAFWKKMWETIRAGKVWTGEIENRRRNGEPFFTQLLVSPILADDGSVAGYLGIHRDLTEQKYLEKQLIHAQKMESMGLLTAGIAHEVGNPLTSISSLVQVLERSTDDSVVRDKLEMIKNQVNRISRILRDLVDFSRRSNYEIELTDVNACVREAIAVVGVARKAKPIAFEFSPDPRLPRLGLVADQIQQVMVNVLINAVDAVDDKFGLLPSDEQSGRIACRSRVDGNDLLIEISDNGKGISEAHLPKIFEPFFTTKGVGEGTGLGLWVSYGIIRSFQGEITARSVEGEGTTFTIRLPLHTKTG